jgi:nickel/cobalt exporter
MRENMRSRSKKRLILSLILLCALCVLCGEIVFAHPVPKQNHDRTIEVKLTPDAVVVKYQLDIDEYRAVQDLSKEEIAHIDSPEAIARVFLRYAAPILCNNLIAHLDGNELTFHGEGKIDDTVKDHLRCDFTFVAMWKPSPGAVHTFTLREANYEREDFDRLDLTLSASEGIRLQETTAPDKTLRERPPLERKPGDDERLRQLSATFTVGEAAALAAELGPDHPAANAAGSPNLPEQPHSQKLLHLLLDTRRGLLVLLLLAAGFGAVHALTPGHGKTLVAAYLVGERGTVWHAVLLGLMTTLTHTGAVFVLAVVFLISPSWSKWIYSLQGLAGGLLIAFLGLWLLVQRLFGRPDHVHLGGSHHHHHDSIPPQASGDGGSVRWWHLVLLGMRGGLVPCWDAILLICLAISAQRLWLGVPLLLAFSAGLAGVLVALGVGVVWARNWVVSRWGSGQRLRKVAAVLPLVSAAVITALGLWLCYDSLHPDAPPSAHNAGP